MFKLTTDAIAGEAPGITQSLDELARAGARRMILAALDLEVEQYVQELHHLRDKLDHAMVVRNGYAREHVVQPIESPFATVNARTKPTGAGSRNVGLAMAFKLLLSAEERWRRVNAPHLVTLVRAGVKFPNGEAEIVTHNIRQYLEFEVGFAIVGHPG